MVYGWFLVIMLQIISMQTIATSLTPVKINTKCVIALTSRNNDIFFRKFYYLQNSCIYMSNERNVMQTKHAGILLHQLWKLELENCTLVTAIDNIQQNILSTLFEETHFLTPDYSHDILSESLLSTLTSTPEITCSQTNHIYTEAIAMMTQHLSVDLVSIIVEDNKCAVDFAESLALEIKNSRGKNHIFMFEVRVYKVKKKAPHQILLSIQREMLSRRGFVMLTSTENTLNYFQASADIKMNQYSDVWIVRHSTNYKNIPSQTMTFSEMTFKEYRPLYGMGKNDLRMDKLTNFSSICPKSIDDPSLTNLMDQYSFFNETKETITIHLWWENTWRILYEVKENENIFTILPHVSEFAFLGALGIHHLEVIKIVSVKEGPFLFTADYLYNSNHSKCETGSLMCREPNRIGNITEWKNTCCYGYTVDLIIHLSNILGFESDLYIVEDGKYGAYDKYLGTLNGMVGDVYNNKAIMAVAGLTATTDRSRYIDFTTPFMRSEIGIVTLKSTPILNYINAGFIDNLGSDMKYIIGTTFLVAIIFICLFDNTVLYRERLYDKRTRGCSSIKMYSWQDSFTYTSGLLFQREIGGINPSTKGGRTTALFFAFAMVAFTTLYTASLTAERVAPEGSNVFKGLKDERMTNPTDKFKFGTSKDTSIESFFKNAPDETLNRMYRFMLKYNVNGLLEGIEKVLSGELQAYLNEYPFLKYYMAQHSDCQVEIHENPIGQSSYGIAVAKGSYIKGVLSEAILTLIEQEVLIKLQKKWLSSDCGTSENASNQFSLYFFATPLLMLAGVMLFCFVILIGEILIWKYLTRKKRAHSINGSMRAQWKQVRDSRNSILVMYK